MCMDIDQLLDVAPLTKGPLTNRRKEITTNLVRYVLNRRHRSGAVSPGDITTISEHYTGIQIDTSEAGEALENLHDSGELSYNEETGKYDVVDLAPIAEIDDQLDAIWGQFQEMLRDRPKDLDPDFLTQRKKSAFDEIIFTYFERLSDSIELLEQTGTDNLLTEDFEEIIDDTIAEHEPKNKEEFKDTLRQFLSDPSDELLDLVDTIYTGAINLNILSKATEIPFEELTEGNSGVLFIDTNMIINLMCRTDRYHSIAKVTCKRSSELGYDLYYLSSTVREVKRVVRGSKREMRNLTNPNNGFIRSQLIQDFFNTNEHSEWQDYLSEFQQWQQYLELKYGLEEYSGSVPPDESVTDFVRTSIDEMERQAGRDEENRKNEKAVQHDADIIGTVAELRKRHTGPLSSAPYLLSFDRTINSISNMGKNGAFWDEQLVFQPRSWLNYILAFTSSDVDHDRRTEVSQAILSSSIEFDDPLTVDDYIELLRTKLDVDADKKDLLEEYIVESPLGDQFTRAVEREKTNDAMETAKQILASEGWQEAFVERHANKEQLKNAREQVDDLESEVSEAEKEAKAYKEALQAQNTIVLDVPKFEDDNSGIDSTQIAELNENLTTLITLLNKEVPDELRSEIPDPPAETSDPSQLTAWLDQVLDELERASGAAKGAEIAHGIAVEASELLSQMTG